MNRIIENYIIKNGFKWIPIRIPNRFPNPNSKKDNLLENKKLEKIEKNRFFPIFWMGLNCLAVKDREEENPVCYIH